MAEEIRRRIRDGQLPIGQPAPPERDLAETLSVSRSTVRQAIELLVEEGWIARRPRCRPVIQSPDRRKYERRTKGDHISVWLWPSTTDTIAAAVFRGIQEVVHHSPYRIVVATAPYRNWEAALASELEFLHQVADDETCAGAILWPIGEGQVEVALRRCHELAVPLAFIDRRPPGDFTGDVVTADNLGSARRVVNHLIEMGHRRIGLLTNVDSASSVAERTEGYRRALAGSGLNAADMPVAHYSPLANETPSQCSERLLRSLLHRPEPPTALFCINDSLAVQAWEACESVRVRVPDDLSLAGFDGLMRWMPTGLRLTTANQDFFRHGETAAELLLERIADPSPERTRRFVYIDAPLFVHGSTAPPAELRPTVAGRTSA